MTMIATDRRALAQKCGIGDPYLYQVLSGRRLPSAELCVLLEQRSEGKVTRRMLRPKDWPAIWPELISSRTPF